MDVKQMRPDGRSARLTKFVRKLLKRQLARVGGIQFFHHFFAEERQSLVERLAFIFVELAIVVYVEELQLLGFEHEVSISINFVELPFQKSRIGNGESPFFG